MCFRAIRPQNKNVKNCWKNINYFPREGGGGGGGGGLCGGMWVGSELKHPLSTYCREDVNSLKFIFTIWGVKIIISSPKWTFRGLNLIQILKILILTSKWSKVFLKLFTFPRQRKSIPVTFQTPLLALIIAQPQFSSFTPSFNQPSPTLKHSNFT